MCIVYTTNKRQTPPRPFGWPTAENQGRGYAPKRYTRNSSEQGCVARVDARKWKGNTQTPPSTGQATRTHIQKHIHAAHRAAQCLCASGYCHLMEN